MGGGGHCSTNGLVNEPAEGWQGVPLRCLLAPDNSKMYKLAVPMRCADDYTEVRPRIRQVSIETQTGRLTMAV